MDKGRKGGPSGESSICKGQGACVWWGVSRDGSTGALDAMLRSFDYAFVLFCFVFPRAAPTAYGGSQAGGLVGAIVISLCHSHSNAGSLTH